jgi:NAD(P)H-dependent FMN reductase
MSEDKHIRLAVIVGSVREGRFGPTVAEWFTGQARQFDQFDVDVIDLADFAPKLPLTLTPELPTEAQEALGSLSPRLAEADAFVIITPEYNHSYPAGLKSVIDWHFTQWQAKPISFVTYGGMAGGLRAAEALRLVFAELHAITIRDTVSFHGGAYAFDDKGQPRDATGAASAAKVMLDQLTWWALALREAREKRPYKA